ncbi:hypothetical protein Dsin_026047 [Dipteronia sinensis]|uniref:BZIP domain-containing protein n=1 Tax=Dipteronia sinensis TaxID=43782 RepID=A0AAD9ZWY2_9ROSI|nr:hypothetical protein Dsin_026047 [Dipteronia sinensis]
MLAQTALSDPKRVKRIQANRESAERSKLKRVKYVAELQQKIQTMETKLAELSAKATTDQSEPTGLASKINELRFHIQATDQQAQLKYDLNNVLITELYRLQHSVIEMASKSDRMDRDIDRIDHDIAEMHLADPMAQQLFIDNENLQSPNQQQQQNDLHLDQFQEEPQQGYT